MYRLSFDQLSRLNFDIQSLSSGQLFVLPVPEFKSDMVSSSNIISMATIHGTSGNDTLDGTSVGDTIYAYEGDDIINGMGGGDNVLAGDGNDTLNGEAGNDTLRGEDGDDVINGGGDNDTIYGGLGTDTIDGGAGTDSAYYTDSIVGVTVYFDGTVGVGGTAQGDTLTNVERVFTSNFADTVYGTTGSDYIRTAFGNDHVYGMGGADDIDMGGGTDTFYLFTGEDYSGATINGGAINGEFSDVLMLDGGNAPATFDLSSVYMPYMNIFEFAGTTSGALTLSYVGLVHTTEIRASALRPVGEDIDIIITAIPDHRGVTYTGLDDSRDSVTLQANSFTHVHGSNITDFGEIFNITGGANNISGYGGDDIFNLGSGGDLVYGGDGNDTINATTGTLNSTRLYGQAGDDLIHGSTVADSLYGGDDNDTINGNGGGDLIYGGNGNDIINGGDANDILYDEDGDDIVSGGDGNDTFWAGDGADSYDGGGVEYDVINYQFSTAGITVHLDGSMAGVGGFAQGDTFANIEGFWGSNLDDVFYDDALVDNQINGQGGNDTVYYAGGADNINVGSGADTLNLLSGMDFTGGIFNGGTDVGNILQFDASDMPGTFDLTTGAFTYFSVLTFVGTTSGTLTYNYNTGMSAISAINASAARAIGDTIDIKVNATGFYQNIVFTGTTYTGLTSGVDTLTISMHSFATYSGSNVTAFAESFIAQSGRGGNNIYGYGGDDYIQGSYGQDNIFAGEGDDTVIGGDTVGSTIRGEAGEDNLTGGASNDTIYGGDDNDTINGLAGADTIYGGSGNDTLNGDAGNDLLFGGFGDDVLFGGLGDDRLIGDFGADTFMFNTTIGNGLDRVMDFEIGTDLLDVSQTGLIDFADVTANMSMAGSWTVIDLGGGDAIWLNNINMGDLSASDFDFGA